MRRSLKATTAAPFFPLAPGLLTGGVRCDLVFAPALAGTIDTTLAAAECFEVGLPAVGLADAAGTARETAATLTGAAPRLAAAGAGRDFFGGAA